MTVYHFRSAAAPCASRCPLRGQEDQFPPIRLKARFSIAARVKARPDYLMASPVLCSD
jgi:hypothetical protein